MKVKSLGNRILSVFLALVMVIGMCPLTAFAAEDTTANVTVPGATQTPATEERLSFHKVEGVEADARLPETKAENTQQEPLYADTDVVRVSIVLTKDATLVRYSAANVASNSEAMAYRESLQKDQAAVITRIENQVLGGEKLDVVWNMTLAANIVSANITYGQLEKIAAVRGVKKVFVENQYAPLAGSDTADPMMTTSADMIGSSAAWAAGYTGAGSRIAIIDTGLDTDHQSFSSEAFLYSLEQNAAAKNMTTAEYVESLDLMDAADVAGVLKDLNIYPFIQYHTGVSSGAYYVNEKVPFAINYVDRDFDATHDNDMAGGHGSHVAGIAAANSYISDGEGGFVSAAKEVSMQGVAPDAQLIIMKVFGKNGGAYESDYMVAIEDAILLGCDVVNLSLGSDKGFTRNTDYQDILDSLAENDVIVAVAAGNAGSWAEYAANGMGHLYVEDVDFSMVASPAASTNTMAVASADNVGGTSYYIGVGDQVLFYNESSFSDGTAMPPLTSVAGDVNYILIDGIGTAEQVAAVVAAEGSIAPNTVFVCARGEINFAVKANNAVEAGFVATIVYNNVEGALSMNMDGYNYQAPAVSIGMANGQKLREAAQPVKDGQGNVLYYKGTMYISNKVASTVLSDSYTMSDFSSWGVPGSLELKPEITAPGGNIYSVNGEDASGKAYMNNSGTSMASPQIAGMAALAMQYIEETGLDQKLGLSSRKLATSLLMSTAEPMMNGNSYYSVLQQGAGLANVGNVVLSQCYILMDAAAASGAEDGKVKAELGDDPDRTGKYSFSFTLNNFGEDAQIYSISGDFFTQATFTYEGITYADTATTPLSMAVSYAVENGYIDASERFDCDLNGDGVTDANDAQVILEYVSGNLKTISDAADVSKNGNVSSYDAHLLLASMGSGYFMVRPGESVEITVSMELTESAKNHLDAVYTNGAYVEGFVTVQPLTTEEGQATPAHSIPVLGFYGNWSDASMYDRLDYHEYVYAVTNGTDFVYPYTGNLNYLTFWDEDNNELNFVGNPYVVEDSFPADKIAIRPTVEIGDMATSLIRNAGGFMFYIEDAEGNMVDYVSAEQLNAAFYYVNGGYWAWVNSAGLSIWMTPEQLGGFQEGDQFTLGFMAVPEYYETDGALTAEDMIALKESGKISQNAYQTYTFTVDGTEPELLDVVKLEDGDLKLKVKDNRHVAAVAVLSASGGTVLAVEGVDQDEINTESEVVIDMEGVRVNRNCLVMVADYAGNETYYAMTYNDGLEDFDGLMYGFTSTKVRGTGNVWMEITPEGLYYDGGDLSEMIDPSMGGTQDMAVMESSVIAAEYVGGHVYMITDENELRVAVQGEWENSVLAAVDPEYAKIKDLAFNTSDGKLYALGANNIIYTVDLYTGALEKQYKITIAAPEGMNELGLQKTFSDENKKLLTLAIDDEGNFYSVNNGDSTYQRVYLYSWSAADVTDGAISDLVPVNNTYYGYAGDYVYNDDIPTTGSPTVQSMAWDHDEDVLYWAAALSAVSPYNYLYTFDVSTGKTSIATEGPIAGVADYCLGCMCASVAGLYIVPKESVTLETTDTANDLIIWRDSVELLEGAVYQVQWDVLPWHLDDKSVIWTTTDPSVVTVDATGRLTAIKEGTATIRATTVAKPQLFATCQVTVSPIQDVSLSGMLYNDEGVIEWVSFDLLDSENWTSNFVANGQSFLAGGQHGDVIYVHDGVNMYGINADTFEATNYGSVHETWLWSDGATGPETPDGYFDRMVGIVNFGLSIGVMNVEKGLGYEISHYGEFTKDPAALIAYVGPTTYHDGYSLNNGHEYYILTEGGVLYHDIVYAFYDTDAMEVVYSDYLTSMGDTGLNLKGASDPADGISASMYYDLTNDYLIVTAYTRGESANVYVFQPEVCAPVNVGSFGTDVWPVVSLYSYNALTDLTVKVKPGKAEVFAGETVQLSASVYMAESDRTVTWSSSDESIATVDKNGLVTALAGGTVTITATSKEKNEQGEHASASATITVKALTQLDTVLHAYIQTEEGGKWVAIDGTNLAISTLSKSDAVYTGAAVADGKIYATDNTYYYCIDPTGNAYTVTKGDNFTDGDGQPFLYMLDGTAAPKTTHDFVDAVTGQPVTGVELGGKPVYVSGRDAQGNNYLTVLENYATGEYLAAALDATYYAAATAYHYSEEINGHWFDFYYVLGYDGMLQHYSLYTGVANGETYVSGGWEVDYIPIGLEFDRDDDLSMTYLESGDFKGIVITNVTDDGIEFWTYDVEKNVLGKMGVLKGATDLVGLCLASDLDITLPEQPDAPEEPEEPAEAAYVYGYVKTATGYAWAKINTKTLTYEVLASDANGYAAAGAVDGKIFAVTGVTKYGNTIYSYQEVDPANGYAIAGGTGATAMANYNPMDFAGAPSAEVTMVDSTTGASVTKTMGGYVVHVSNGKYTSSKPMVFLVQSYTKGYTELYTSSDTFDSKLAGILYVGSELSTDGKSYYDDFLILDQSGKLYELRVTSIVKNGTVTLGSGQPAVTETDVVLDLTLSSSVSMARYSQNKAYIVVNNGTAAQLYAFDLSTYALKELGAVDSAVSVVGLHTDAELTGVFGEDAEETPTEPEEPEEPTEPETPTEPEDEVDAIMVHAYIHTDKGYAWAKVNTATGKYTVLSDYSTTAYTGAGDSEGKIYATALDVATQQYLVSQIDGKNGYTVTTGKGNNLNLPMRDLAAAPVQTVSIEDAYDLSMVEVTVGALVYVACDNGTNYLVVTPDYTRKTSTSEEYVNITGTEVVAIEYLSSKTSSIGIFHGESFAVLCANGDLYTVMVKYSVDMGEVCYDLSVSSPVSTGLTGLTSATMTMVAENQLCIAATTASGINLYSYDVSTNTLGTAVAVAGVDSLVGISLLSDVQTTQTAAAGIKLPAKIVNIVRGSTMTIVATAPSVELEGDAVVIKDGEVMVHLAETKDVTNGKLTVTFDPSVLTFKGLSSAAVLYSVNVSEAGEGKLVISYASGTPVNANDVLATLVFTHDGEVVDTAISVQTGERNDTDAVSEEVVIIPVSNVPPKSEDNSLKSLTAEEGTLTPTFDPNVTEYTVSVSHDVEKLTVVATANDEKATVTVDSPALTAGGETKVKITVTAENGDVKVYTITVTRAAASTKPGTTPGTGDSFRLLPVAMLMLFSALALTALVVIPARKRKAH